MSKSDKKSVARTVLNIICGVGFIALIVAVVMWLWNELVPRITGWNTINYWQALGLMILFRLINGNLFSGKSFKKNKASKSKQPLHQLKPEERNALLRRLMSDSDNDTVGNNIVRIFQKYRVRLLAFIRNRISQGDAEDVLQDVFVSFLLASDTGDPINRVSSWLYQTTKNKIIDNNRKHTEERMSQIAVQQGGEIYFEDITETLTDETTPENDYLRNLLEEELEAALSELPEKQRYVFEQTEFLGRTFKDLSEELDDPVATLISRKHYAVKYLRNRLKYIYEQMKN